VSGNSVRRHEVVEENRLIVGTSNAVLAGRPGWPERAWLASTGAPRPPASRGGGGCCLGPGQQRWRRQRELASKAAGALRPHVFSAKGVSSTSVCGFEAPHVNSTALLREAHVHFERALRGTSLAVAWPPSNPALHRTPPRNALGQAATSGCRSRPARLRCTVGGSAGELQNVMCQTGT
jgi:hypothetical protein